MSDKLPATPPVLLSYQLLRGIFFFVSGRPRFCSSHSYKDCGVRPAGSIQQTLDLIPLTKVTETVPALPDSASGLGAPAVI